MLRIFIQRIRCTKIDGDQHIRHYALRHRYRPNLGIRRQAKAATNDIEYGSIDSTQWDDDLSKYEGDLGNANHVYEQYRQESRMGKDNVRLNLVRNKYFDEKKLSFLTWSEMEQIRMLNANDPEEWNVLKLAESFPADVTVIRKVLRAKWQPKNSRRIARHDEMVQSNWKSFRNGELNEMDKGFREHLEKFSTRNVNTKTDYDCVLNKRIPKPNSTEFLQIITSSKKSDEEPKRIGCNERVNKQLTITESSKPTRIQSDKLYTFRRNESDTSTSNAGNTAILFNNPSGTGTVKPNVSNEQSVTMNDRIDNKVQLHQSEFKLSMPSIRQRINIPEKLFKQGATYRLEDCYYDDDGEFLYRVPGMTKL